MENKIETEKIVTDSPLTITPESELYLKSSASWASFLSIIGFVGITFMIIVGIFSLTMSSFLSDFSDFSKVNMTGIGIVYLIMAIFYIFPTYYLFQFGDKMKTALKNHIQSDMDESLKKLKSMFKFIGIMTVIAICISIASIVFAITVLGMSN